MKVDLHVHSRYSACSNMAPSVIIGQARKVGLDAVAITDHNTVEGCGAVKKVAGDIEIIPGIEVKTESGDLIGLFVEENIDKGLGVEETADRIRELGGLVVVPHAFDRMRKSIGERITDARPDAIEVYNNRVLFGSFNERAEEYALANSITGVAGSDAHFQEEVGLAGIFTETGNIRKCIEKGRVKTYRLQLSFGARFETLCARYARRVQIKLAPDRKDK